MRVLVTGASGFVGRALTAALLARHNEVLELTHREPRSGQVGVDLSSGTLDKSRLPGGELGALDAVVHLAGSPIFTRWSGREKEKIRASRIAYADVIIRDIASWPTPPAVFVTASAVGFYGERGESVVEEGSEKGAGFLSDVCQAWETAASGATAYGTRVVALRTGIVLGKGGGALGLQATIFRLGLGGRLGSGRQWMSWISLKDHVSVILGALDDASWRGPFNSVSPQPVRNADYTVALGGALHRPTPFPVPAAAIRAAFGKGTADEMVLVSQRVMPSRLADAGFEFEHPDLDSALVAGLG